MRTTRFSETEIVYAVKQVEAGISIKEIARKYGVCENTVYRWRRKYVNRPGIAGDRIP